MPAATVPVDNGGGRAHGRILSGESPMSRVIPVAVLSLTLAGLAGAWADEPGPVKGPTPDAALARLKEGHARFVAGKSTTRTIDAKMRAQLAKGQNPFAVILTCADSRVPPEMVFDLGFGDLFVLRVAGNVTGPAVLGSVE